MMWKKGFLQSGKGLKRVIGRLLPDSSGEEAHRARMLLVAGFLFVITGVLFSFIQIVTWVHPAFPPPPASDLVVDFLVMLIGGLTVWVVGSERIPLATWVVIGSLFAVAVGELYLEGRPPTDVAGGLGLFLIVVLAFVLLDRESAWWVFAAAAASFVVIHILWLGGYLPQEISRDPFGQVAFSILTWLAIAGIVSAVISSTMRALQKHRVHLEEMVEARTAQLHESEVKMRAQYKGIPVPTYTWRRTGEDFVLEEYNDAAEEITKGKIAEFVGASLREMYRENPQVRQDIERCYAERTIIEREMDYQYKTTDESKRLAVKYAFVPPDLVLVHTEDITERVRAEQELRLQSEIISNMAEGVYLVRARDGVIVYTNPKFDSMFGYDPEELIGKHVSVVNAPDEMDPKDTADQIIKTLKETGEWAGEVHNIRKDGTTFWCYATVSTFEHQEHGTVWVSIHQDITERKWAHQLLERRMDELKALVAMATIVNQSQEVKEILERAIDEALRQVGVKAAAILLLDEGVGELELVTHRGLSEEFVQAFHRLRLGEGLAGQVAETGEPTILRDLREYPEARRSYVASEAIRSAASVPLVGRSGVIGVMNLGAPSPEHFDAEGIELLVDLGRQIAIGVEKAQLYQEVRENEQRFQRLSRAASEGIMIHDQGRIVEANRTFAEMFGYKLSELVGMDGFKLIAPESRELVGKHINAGYEESYEASLLRKDGTTFPAELIGKEVPYQGRTLRIVIIRDITERKEMREQLMRQERLAVLGKLAGGVGHELRNPLGSIKNAAYFLNMALAERELEPEVEETLGILEREVERSERIVSDLLDFARVRSPKKRKVDINEMTREVFSHTEIPERVEVVEQLEEDLRTLMADPDQLEQVIRNLVQNAVQAMPEGGRLTVETKKEDPGWLSVSIADTGMGIPEEKREKIFEPLFTTKAKGIGLGLAIVRTLVEGHGGAIEVESEVGEGSTFVVKLPVGISHEED